MSALFSWTPYFTTHFLCYHAGPQVPVRAVAAAPEPSLADQTQLSQQLSQLIPVLPAAPTVQL